MRLLDDSTLSSSDRALLAAYVVCDLHELETFNARQVSETLQETGSPIANVTAALNGLIQKGWIFVQEKLGGTAQAQKRYGLSSAGRRKVMDMIEPPEGASRERSIRTPLNRQELDTMDPPRHAEGR